MSQQKAKSSTQSSTEKSGKNVPEIQDLPETPVDNSVDDSNKSQTDEKFITIEKVRTGVTKSRIL
ncbi:hypothetical protein DDW13_06410 [Acidianus hospitalis]|uniref:Uncharacterized protein n=1 Tax=Acidianus hospitalis TaxID=563177 RepID=A0A2T9X3P3_9CREN|nr:hypothetical protein DDW13_06410 [Acidianus hospitalis]